MKVLTSKLTNEPSAKLGVSVALWLCSLPIDAIMQH